MKIFAEVDISWFFRDSRPPKNVEAVPAAPSSTGLVGGSCAVCTVEGSPPENHRNHIGSTEIYCNILHIPGYLWTCSMPWSWRPLQKKCLHAVVSWVVSECRTAWWSTFWYIHHVLSCAFDHLSIEIEKSCICKNAATSLGVDFVGSYCQQCQT